MSAWIKMRTDLAQDMDVITLARLTNSSRITTVGRLYFIWSWADLNTQDGELHGIGVDEEIDNIADKKGFAKAMEQVGWLVIHSKGVTFPSYEKHNGASAKRRANDAIRKGQKRQHEQSEQTRQNGQEPEQAPASCPQNVRIESGHFADQIREDKIREETPVGPQGGDAAQEWPLPKGLDTPAFRASWEQWLQYLGERHGKRPPIMTLERHLQTCLAMGAGPAIAAIENAINRSLREPSAPLQPSAKQAAKADVVRFHAT
jgi:hypothetical protein